MVSKFIIGTFSIFVILIMTSEVVSKATTGKPEQSEVKKTPDIPGGPPKVGSRGLLDGTLEDLLSIGQEKDDEVSINKVEEDPRNPPPTTAIPAAPSTTTPAAPSTTTPAAPSTTTPAAPSTTTPAAPSTTTPAAPSTTTPAAPSTTTPAAPSTTTPAAPSTTTPAAPSTTTPAAPSTTTPAAPSTTTPAAPSTTTPATNPNEQKQKDLRELLSNIREISDAFSKNIPIQRPPNTANPSTSNALPISLPQVLRHLSLISEIQRQLISYAITNCDKMETPPQAPFQLRNPNEISSEAAIQKVNLTSATSNLSQLLAQLIQQKGGADEHNRIQLPPGLKPNPLVDSGNKGALVTIGQQTNPDPNKGSVNNELIEEKREIQKDLRSTLSRVKELLGKPKQ